MKCRYQEGLPTRSTNDTLRSVPEVNNAKQRAASCDSFSLVRRCPALAADARRRRSVSKLAQLAEGPPDAKNTSSVMSSSISKNE